MKKYKINVYEFSRKVGEEIVLVGHHGEIVELDEKFARPFLRNGTLIAVAETPADEPVVTPAEEG